MSWYYLPDDVIMPIIAAVREGCNLNIIRGKFSQLDADKEQQAYLEYRYGDKVAAISVKNTEQFGLQKDSNDLLEQLSVAADLKDIAALTALKAVLDAVPGDD